MFFTVTLTAGQGFDRHLFALRTLAEEGEEELPAIFTDQSYRHLCHIILSTSTLSTDSVLIGGFAPVTSDGYGIGYNVRTFITGNVVWPQVSLHTMSL